MADDCSYDCSVKPGENVNNENKQGKKNKI